MSCVHITGSTSVIASLSMCCVHTRSMVAPMFCFFAGMFVLFQVVLLWERAILRRELRAEVIEHGTLPESHIEPLTSWRLRAFSTFVAGAVDQAAYGKAAVTLALRRHQVRIAKGRRKTLLQVDLDRLRREVRSLLGA